MDIPVTIADLDLPEFGLPTTEPEITTEIYLRRIERFAQRGRGEGYDVLVVYGDREHSANLRYLTGYDPRFEEALLVMDLTSPDSRPCLLAGNEGFGYTGTSPVREHIRVELFQSLSLLGQDRSKSRYLEAIFEECGVTPGKQVGTAGWKHFDETEGSSPETMFEIPSYIIDILRELTEAHGNVRNANAMLMDSTSGMRVHNELEQLAWFEFAGSHASESVKRVLFGARPGMSEYEAAELMRLNGIPLSCHPMLSSGDRAYFGMGSPSMKRLGRGEPFTTAVGLWGALTSRAGFLVESESELSSDRHDYLERLVIPYFGAIVAWYETMRIGVSGGELFDVIDSRIGDDFYGVSLNPGHQIHLDEWVNSPVYKGSEELITSGMAIQVDVIPATGGPYYTTNIEDGILIADEELRRGFADRYPEAWSRIESRREYMETVLGIRLAPEVLPTSNIPAYLPPYILAPRMAMRVAR